MRKSRNLWIRLSWDIFFSEQCVVLMRISGQTPNSMDSGLVEAELKVNIRSQFFEKFWSKNDVSQIDPGSLWEGPGTSRASKNVKGITKYRPWGLRKISRKWPKNLLIWRVFGSYFLKFPMLAHVLPGGGPRGILKWLVEHISCAL